MITTLKRQSAGLRGLHYCSNVGMALVLGLMLSLPLQAEDSQSNPDGAASIASDSKVTDQTTVWKQTSRNGLFNVTLDAQTTDSIEINEFLEWELNVTTKDGQHVSPARIAISGGMPMHGHGLPTQPQVSQYQGSGKYLIKGLLFSMHGNWTLAMDIQSKALRDQVTFEVTLEP